MFAPFAKPKKVDMSSPATPDSNELHAALFAQLVMQQANLATLLMGRTPHPETGKTTRDLEAAQMFIDQLEMLESKTRGNLSPQESGLLKQTLMSLRLAFVEAANEKSIPEEESVPPATGTPTGANPVPASGVPRSGEGGEGTAARTSADPPPVGESGKRFSKTYPG